MPLKNFENFKTKLQRNNRLVVPKLLRWKYKIGAGELFRVSLKPVDAPVFGVKEEFFAKMSVDGRLTVPKLNIQALESAEKVSLVGRAFEVTLYPA